MVTVLIPAYNEAERIAGTIAAVRALAVDEGLEVIVIDDGSGDDTARIADAAGADVVIRQTNGGKGAALTAGAAIASGKVLLLLDADIGATATESTKLLGPILGGEADMTIAMFPVHSGRGGGAGLVVRLARWGIYRLTGRTMNAPLSGQRALTRETLERSGGFATGWGVEISLTVRALQSDCRVIEVDTTMDHRVTGRSLSAVLHRASQFRDAAFVLFRLWRTHVKVGSSGNSGHSVND